MRDKSDTIKKGQNERKQRFLNELLSKSVLGNVRIAAANTGVNRQLLYRWRTNDEKFAKEWDEVKKEADEALIAIAESALIGAIQAGNITAIIFTLKARAPERWGESQRKIGNGRIEDEYTVSPEFSAAMDRMLNAKNRNTTHDVL